MSEQEKQDVTHIHDQFSQELKLVMEQFEHHELNDVLIAEMKIAIGPILKKYVPDVDVILLNVSWMFPNEDPENPKLNWVFSNIDAIRGTEIK